MVSLCDFDLHQFVMLNIFHEPVGRMSVSFGKMYNQVFDHFFLFHSFIVETHTVVNVKEKPVMEAEKK